jgi:hypothetical protein
MECQYCKNIFSNKINLNAHQKNAKYCLKLRNEENKIMYKCQHCEKMFSNSSNLTRHTKICQEESKKEIRNLEKRIKELEEENIRYKMMVEQKDKIIEEQKEQINDLQNKMENIAIKAVSKPTYINNNNNSKNQIINNLVPITENHFREQVEYLTIDHIKNGVDGYVQYALEYPLKDRVICTDFARRKIKYKDQEGNIIDDPEMAKLSQKFFQAIEEKNAILADEYLKELQNKYGCHLMNSTIEEIDENERNERNDETENEEKEKTEHKFTTIGNTLLEELFKVNVQKREIKEAANGSKPEIYHEFVKNVCSKVVT